MSKFGIRMFPDVDLERFFFEQADSLLRIFAGGFSVHGEVILQLLNN